MTKEYQIILSPNQAFSEKDFVGYLAKHLGIDKNRIKSARIIKRSIDARSRNVKVLLRIAASIDQKSDEMAYKPEFRDVSGAPEVHIAGTGPAGLFAALKLLELGLKPVIFERGKEVSERKRDIANLNSRGILNPDSNYCFGEGGAGTFSDGKLYTRSSKRGNISEVLSLLTYFGANEEILYDSHPHIGSDKLPAIIKNIREQIISCGGMIHFNSRLTDIEVIGSQIKAIVINGTEKLPVNFLILATGHSASDIYRLLFRRNILIENKPFAMGVRVEHPQEIINKIQYGPHDIKHLPPAAYGIVRQVSGRGVYSFCMCPGGVIVPAMTEENTIVVNGMSNSGRTSPYANSGIVVEIKPEIDFRSAGNPLAGLDFQHKLEALAFKNASEKYQAPAQRMIDFVKQRSSKNLPSSSYHPGLCPSDLHSWLPKTLSKTLRDGFRQFGNMMQGYLSNDAIVVGVESRTSSPVRIPRDKDTFEHVQIKGLFPCGEGAGYAGGITSCAIDGIQCAIKIAGISKR